jgi:predicted nucleic acid-binding protein
MIAEVFVDTNIFLYTLDEDPAVTVYRRPGILSETAIARFRAVD